MDTKIFSPEEDGFSRHPHSCLGRCFAVRSGLSLNQFVLECSDHLLKQIFLDVPKMMEMVWRHHSDAPQLWAQIPHPLDHCRDRGGDLSSNLVRDHRNRQHRHYVVSLVAVSNRPSSCQHQASFVHKVAYPSKIYI